jgi:hypothetical protein
MTSKKKRRSGEVKARKKKKSVRLILLSLVIAVVIGFLAFLGISLYDFILPPTGKGIPAVKKEKLQAVLYFSDANERFLVPEKRFIPRERTVNAQAEELVKALIEGPGEGLKTGLTRTFPEGTLLKSVRVEKDGLAWVDFDKTLVDRHPGGSSSEVATVYSLTNTLVQNLSAIKKVQIMVDGKVHETLNGHVDTRYPFTFNKELVKDRSVAE